MEDGAREESKFLTSEALAEDTTGSAKTRASPVLGGHVEELKLYSTSFDVRKGAQDGDKVVTVGVVWKQRQGGVAKAGGTYTSFLHDMIGVSGIKLDDKERPGSKSPIADAGVVAPDDKEWLGKLKSKLDAGVLVILVSYGSRGMVTLVPKVRLVLRSLKVE
jgi:hypothetical protein